MTVAPFPGDLLPISRRGSGAIRRLKNRLWEQQDGLCFYCDAHMVKSGNPALNWSLDHVVALALGGADDETNVVLCCHQCNRCKGCLTAAQLRHMADRIEQFCNPMAAGESAATAQE